jgi:hypothetical protein
MENNKKPLGKSIFLPLEKRKRGPSHHYFKLKEETLDPISIRTIDVAILCWLLSLVLL